MSSPPSWPTSWARPRPCGLAERSRRWPASPSSSSSSLDTIELGHGPLETVLDREEHGVSAPRHHVRQLRLLAAGKGTQDVVGAVPRRAANPDSKTDEVLAAEGCDQRVHPVVAGGAAPLADAHPA